MSSNGSSRTEESTTRLKELYNALMKENWPKVVELFRADREIHATKIADMVQPNDDEYDYDTALHWAITNKAPESIVFKLVDEIKRAWTDRAWEILKAKNKRGDTPLHCAASRGSTFICIAITEDDVNSNISAEQRRKSKSLVRKRNNEGETPLFLAALNGHQWTFLYLDSICREVDSMLPFSFWKRKNGDTILHCTIRRKFFALSHTIIELYKDKKIGSHFNEEGNLPLNEIVSIPSAFKNGTRLRWWWQQLYYYVACVGRLQSEDTNSSRYQNLLNKHRVKLRSERDQSLSNSNSCQTQANASPDGPEFLENQKSSYTNDHLTQSISSQDSVGELKRNHRRAKLIMDELVKQDPWYKLNDHAREIQEVNNSVFYMRRDKEIQKGRIKKSTALLIAAKNGLVEQVENILDDIPVSIHDQLLEEKKNIVHVAVKERQSYVLEVVKKHKLWSVLSDIVDAEGNNALHLAAKQSKLTTGKIRGSVMQMQWEIMWFEYVKESMPPYFISQPNNGGQTPVDIFDEEHEKLLEECNESVKDTCGSYMIASTLITGGAFAVCYQDPDKFGHTFSISLLISFCFSITSLATFLTIYSTRKEQAISFRRSLPFKLYLGFFSFFVSLVSMMVSFCAALSHDLHPRDKWKPIILCIVFLIPAVLLYPTTQFRLYKDLLVASFSEVPKPRIVDEEVNPYIFRFGLRRKLIRTLLPK